MLYKYIHTYIYTYIYIYIYIYIHTCIHTHIYIHIHMDIHIYRSLPTNTILKRYGDKNSSRCVVEFGSSCQIRPLFACIYVYTRMCMCM